MSLVEYRRRKTWKLIQYRDDTPKKCKTREERKGQKFSKII